MVKFSKDNYLIILFSIIYLAVGLYTYKDYGLGIEEHFQRSSGFYWLNYLLQFTNFENLQEITQSKIFLISQNTPYLPSVEGVRFYGIIFDVPAAFIEILLKFEDVKDYFYFRHLINFFIFYLSGVLFFIILKMRIKINLICFIGFAIYLLSPRIYGNSFFDSKDLFFLSVFTITTFFYFNYERKKSFLNLLIFSLFCAISTSSRIIGLVFPISFILIILLKLFDKDNIFKNLKILFLFIFFYLITLFVHWPYLWTLNIQEYLDFFNVFKSLTETTVFFNGEFYSNNFLPISYLPLWILISTPLFILFLFFCGIFYYLKRIFLRLISIKENSISYDIWRSENEKKDFFIFLILIQILILYINFKINLYGGWRIFLFLNFFISYFASLGIYTFYLRIQNNYKLKILSIFFISIFFIELIFKLYLYHPYQSVYFNNLTNEKTRKLFEIDTQSLSRVDALKFIVKNSPNKEKIKVGTASWTPLENAKYFLSIEDRNKLIFTGTTDLESADFIYTNYFYETDIRYNKKYDIPANFYLFKKLKLNDTRIYSIYKNKSTQ